MTRDTARDASDLAILRQLATEYKKKESKHDTIRAKKRMQNEPRKKKKTN